MIKKAENLRKDLHHLKHEAEKSIKKLTILNQSLMDQSKIRIHISQDYGKEEPFLDYWLV